MTKPVGQNGIIKKLTLTSRKATRFFLKLDVRDSFSLSNSEPVGKILKAKQAGQFNHASLAEAKHKLLLLKYKQVPQAGKANNNG